MPRSTHPHRRSRAAAALAATLALLAAAPGAQARSHRPCAHANTPAAQATRAQMRKAVTCLINRERSRHGLPALHDSRLLDHSAQGWTDKMIAIHQFSHGADFAARISAAGFNWSWAGENIATGFATPAEVVHGWMGSPGHCRNILDPDFSRVGTGVRAHGVPGLGIGPSTWTQDFALPMNAQPPSGNHGPQNGCPYSR